MTLGENITINLAPLIPGDKTLVRHHGASQHVWGGLYSTGDKLRVAGKKGICELSNIHITVPEKYADELPDGTIEFSKFHVTIEFKRGGSGLGSLRYFVEESENGVFHTWCLAQSQSLIKKDGVWYTSTFQTRSGVTTSIADKTTGWTVDQTFNLAEKIANKVAQS